MVLALLAQAGGTSSSGGIMGFLPFILILLIIYFLMLRPQMKRQKEHAAMINALQKNDEIVTSGGLHGRIVRVNEKNNTLQIQIARGVIVTIERSSVGKRSTDKVAAPKQIPETKETPEDKPKAQPDNKNKNKRVSSQPAGAGKSKTEGIITSSPENESESRGRSRRRPRRNPRRYRQPNKPSNSETKSE